MTPDKLAEIRARAAAALQGPWRWGGNTDIHRVYLYAPHGREGQPGMHEVMDFERWGMHKAQPRFLNHKGGGPWMVSAKELPIYEVAPDATSRDDKRVYRGDIIGLRHPDAEFIAHARQDVDDLLAYIDHLREELAGYDPLSSTEDNP